MFCTNCGKKLERESRFCPFCGAKLGMFPVKKVNTGKILTISLAVLIGLTLILVPLLIALNSPPQEGGIPQGSPPPEGITSPTTGQSEISSPEVSPPPTTEVASHELIPYRKGVKWGFCDRNKNMVIQPVYDLADPFSEGLAAVQFNGKWGFIDKQGNQYWED